MGKYKLEKVGGAYFIQAGNDPVLTPAGNPFSSKYKRLAALVCEDMGHYGHDPRDSSSYVTLHSSFLDFGSSVPKSELQRSILSGYTPNWDIALARLGKFDNMWSSGSGLVKPAGTGFVLDPMMYFGPPEETPVIRAWVETLSTRALCSMQVCGATFHSILVGYSLLHFYPKDPATLLARGIVALSSAINPSLVDEDSQENTEKRILGFLEKIKTYVAFPDEDFAALKLKHSQ